MRRALLVLASCALACCSAVDPALGPRRVGDPPEAGARTIFFGRDIRPLMDRSDDDPSGHGCRHCHYPGREAQTGFLQTGRDLSTLGGVRATLPDGARIVIPFDPEASSLVIRLRGTQDRGSRMPDNGPPHWRDEDIQKVVTWIAEGAQGDDAE